MEYRQFGPDYVVRLDRGEEITAALTALCEKEGIRLASVQGLGASDHAVMGVFDPERKAYVRSTLTGPMEIASLLGSVSQKDGKPYLHLHATLCGMDQIARDGHVLEINVSLTCEITLHCIDGEVGRQLNEELGINLLRFS